MEEITVYKTRDGVMHTTFDVAKRHADKRYTDRLCTIAHQMVKKVKYIDMVEYIDKNLEHFLTLNEMKKDLLLTKEEDVL